MIETEQLPTPVAISAKRVNVAGDAESADTFLAVSYLAEASIKYLTLALNAGLCRGAPQHAYRLSYDMVRADGLGTWETAIRSVSSRPLAGHLPSDFGDLLAWLTRSRTRNEDEWFRDGLGCAQEILRDLDVDLVQPKKPSARDLITALVLIRNKTKAHGAVGPDFFAAENEKYQTAVRCLVDRCPAFSWQWLHLSRRTTEKTRAILLQGTSPRHLPQVEADKLTPVQAGIYILTPHLGREYWLGTLIQVDRECSKFLVPNGSYNSKQATGEFIDYGTGKTERVSVEEYVAPPAERPCSETAGLDSLEIQSNIFGNLPNPPTEYVHRPRQEEELQKLLLDKNHTIITLHGRGGCGKTCLGLYMSHDLANLDDPPFESIVWFSARDVDLRPTGPVDVKPEVIDLEAVSKLYGAAFGAGETVDDFAKAL